MDDSANEMLEEGQPEGSPSIFSNPAGYTGVYLSRAVFFLNNYRNEAADPQIRAMLLASALHACDSAIEALDGALIPGLCDDTIRKEFSELPRKTVVQALRNMDVHRHPIPPITSESLFTFMETGLKRPLEFSCKNGGAISIQMAGARPEIKRKSKKLEDANVSFGTSVVLSARTGRYYTCDFTRNREEVEVSIALSECINGLLAIYKKLQPSSEG